MKHQKGFTIIEVVLVLAIGGLILSMVFFALPAMLGNQRDTDRRNDVITFIAKLKEFESNSNRGGLPEGIGAGNNVSGIPQTGFIDGGIVATDRNETDKTKKQFNARSWNGFYRDYLDNNFTDPEYDNPYNLVIAECTASNVNADCEFALPAEAGVLNIQSPYDAGATAGNTIFVVTGSICDGERAVKSSNSRRVSALIKLERGGVACQNT
ncbi:prepilin-type N-terminal cleavage/methylation domain-containing protein [Candidatus Saccharibacteria bacterium]|nr:prepilin-type N-terminal cleavage/methylation domain-containing protein [Candidatus Saccharibacteria bacterium]